MPSLARGGGLNILSGSLALLCLVLDYGWGYFPNWWDLKYNGDLSKTISLVASLYVVTALPAAVVFWTSIVKGTLFRAIHCTLGCLLTFLVWHHNQVRNEGFIVSSQWPGPQWGVTENLILISSLLAVTSYVLSFPMDEHLWFRNTWRRIVSDSASSQPLLGEATTETSDDGNEEQVSWPVFNQVTLMVESSHGPLIFGCAAYLLALTVCSFSLVMSFSASEPFSDCFQSVSRVNAPSLEINSHLLGRRFELGNDCILIIDTIGIRIEQASVFVWESPPHNGAFLQAAVGPLIQSSADLNLYYMEDIQNSITSTQTVDEVLEESSNGIVLQGRLRKDSSNYIPYNASVRYENDGVSLTFQVAFESFSDYDSNLHDGTRIYVSYRSSASMAFGFGTQLSAVDLHGTCFPIIAREKGIGRGLQPLSFLLNRFASGRGGSWQHSHTGIHFYVQPISNSFRSVLVPNAGFTVFDLTRSDRTVIEMSGSSEIIIAASETPVNLLRHSKRRINNLPDWLGDGMVLDITGGSPLVIQKLIRISSVVPVSAVVIRDWAGSYDTDSGSMMRGGWHPDQRLYPNWKDTVAQIRTMGIKVLVSISPRVAHVAGNESVFSSAVKLHCLVGSERPLLQFVNPFHEFAFADILKHRCRDYFSMLIIDGYHAGHYDGWVADEGENLPISNAAALGTSSVDHGRYAKHWIRMNRDIVHKLNDGAFFISRTATAESVGDVMLNYYGNSLQSWDKFDGLASVVSGMLSAGLSGICCGASSVGGVRSTDNAFGVFKIRRTPELMKRWIEMSAFSDIALLNHEGLVMESSGKNAATIDEIASHATIFVNIHRSLWKYKMSLVKNHEATGLPMARHLWIHYPYIQSDLLHSQFLLGEEYLICPVLKPNVDYVRCFVPIVQNYSWVHFWSNVTLSPDLYGRDHLCHAPLGQPCVFKRMPRV